MGGAIIVHRKIPAALAAAVTATAIAMAATPAHAAPSDVPGMVTQVGDMADYQRIPGAAVAKKVVYWTRDSLNRPALSSGVLLIPAGTPPAGGWPLVAWEHGTTGRSNACAPSETGFPDARDYMHSLLVQGYAVAASDYIGLGTGGDHAYLDGRAAAQASVDMIRAAHTINDSLTPAWVAVGHSQGGNTTLFTASLATSYAPELDYRGAVAFAPGSSVTDTMLLLGRPGISDVLPPAMKAYFIYALGGLKAARPEFDLDSYLTPLGRQAMADGARLCNYPMADEMTHVPLADVFAKPLTDGDFERTARPVFDVPTTGYDRPLMVVQGTNDLDVPAPAVWKQVAELQANGVRVDLRNYPGLDHEQILDASVPEVNPYLQHLFR
ncbi:lipase family protein [Nocardia sp. NPDC050175]|uniref:lipase family protein n=1 Tax=Nocardia sp. NPDC050175 TaxID=3364317 RepID=UPI00378BCA5A